MMQKIGVGCLVMALVAACGGGARQQGDASLPTAGAGGSVADGEKLIAEGDFEGARALFAGLAAETPEDPRVHYYLGLSKRQLGDLEGAVAAYERAAALDPELMDARINLGLLLLELGEPDRAEAELSVYLAAFPEAADAHFNYGLVQEAMRDLEKARAHYEKAAELDPEDPDPLFGLGDLARKEGDAKGAVALYERARGLDGDQPELVFVEGETLLEMGETARACALFKTLLEMPNPDLAVVSEAGKRIAGADQACAISLYEGALDANDRFAAAHFYLGNLLARGERFREAAAHFEAFLAIAPDDPAAPEARKRLEAARARMK